jgi:hypothetical protein
LISLFVDEEKSAFMKGLLWAVGALSRQANMSAGCAADFRELPITQLVQSDEWF